MAQAPALVAAGVKVIDLAADFRLQDAAEFEKWYKLPHGCTDILKNAVYGLPELYATDVQQAQVIGNPGCYPTTVLLGLAPLLENGWIDFSVPVIADAKSGVSGAGRKAEVGTLFSEASDNLKAYGVAGHRHHPEILAQLKKLSGNQAVNLIFVPHLIPMIRGMLTTLHVKLNAQGKQQSLQQVYEQRYQTSTFVDVMPAGALPETRSVRSSNFLRIALYPQADDYVTIIVVQDNLVKGASGQAVQNMNLMFNLAQDAGLQVLPLLP
ncbi:MAG: N-acetyl-gamma-glutamyl-phosphate reductase, partial [Ignavibacteria bacterium]|nr:N-acetyl-gamma-glutamyl-phosphate reductase [Ignavibacteria bacterium]